MATFLGGKYRVNKVLGSGGMGTVIAATHLQLGQRVALKILLPEYAGDTAVVERFLREARAAAQLRSEHVCRASDIGTLESGAPYIVMELLEGRDLARVLAEDGPLPVPLLIEYVLQACVGLAEAHANGLVHRDLKPANLFLTSGPSGRPLIKLVDFGIAKASSEAGLRLTQTATVMGSPGYMSPEQLRSTRDVDVRTDIWALGVILFELACGHPPFMAPSIGELTLRVAHDRAPSLTGSGDIHGFNRIVHRCLEKDPTKRFRDVAQLAAALAPLGGAGARERAMEVFHVLRARWGGGAGPLVAKGRDTPTTLSASAVAMAVGMSGRSWLGVLLVVLAAVSVAVFLVVRLRVSTPAEPATEDTSASPQRLVMTSPPATDSVVTATSPARSTNQVEITEGTAVRSDDIKACVELEVKQKWQELHDCAAELAVRGAKDKAIHDKADEFRQKAVRETAAQIAADKFQSSLRDGNLREAQRQLRVIGPDSVYYAANSDAFRTAETRAIEDNRRKAAQYASAHDCVGLKRLQGQLGQSSTPAVTGAVATVKCSDEPAAASGTSGQLQVAEPSTSGDVGQSAARTPCDTLVVEDLVVQAQNQFTAGFARSALELIIKGLACKQDVRMYRYAVTYACTAHDYAAAKLYFSKVPLVFQPPLIQKCQLENIIVP